MAPVYPRRSTYRLNQRKALTRAPSSLDHTSSSIFFPGDPQKQIFAVANAHATKMSKYKSRDCLKPRRFSWQTEEK